MLRQGLYGLVLVGLVLGYQPVTAEDVPTDAYVNNGDGTVTHKATGLMWMRCALGQTWNGDCRGDYKTFTFAGAAEAAQSNSFAGYKDWRVPNTVELNSIVERGRVSPATNAILFPRTPEAWFWSSSPYVGSTYGAWRVNFNDGDVDYDARGYASAVRLVRGGQLLDSLVLNDFVDNQDGTVTHTKTGLMWKRCAEGQTFSSFGCEGSATPGAWAKAGTAAAAVDFAGYRDWRLPTVGELQTLIDRQSEQPATNPELFPFTPEEKFWTGTVYAANQSQVWYVGFKTGVISTASKTDTAYTRLVRTTGIPTSPATPGNTNLGVTLTDNPDPVKAGANLTYTATVSNASATPAQNAVLTLYVPGSAVSLPSVPGDCEARATGVVCRLGTVAAKASLSRAVVVQVKKPGGLSVSVQVRSDTADSQPDDNIARSVTTIQ